MPHLPVRRREQLRHMAGKIVFWSPMTGLAQRCVMAALSTSRFNLFNVMHLKQK